jgi:hypothetical protein
LALRVDLLFAVVEQLQFFQAAGPSDDAVRQD